MWTVTKIKDKIRPVEVYLKSGEKHCILTLNHYSIWLARGLAHGVAVDINEDKEILTIQENGKYTWNHEVKCCGNCEHHEKCQDTCQYFVCSKHKSQIPTIC